MLTAGFIYIADYLCFSVFWSNLEPREHIFPPPVVFDFQFPDNICYLAVQRPYLSLQVCIVIHFIWMYEWHNSAVCFFFLSQSGYSSNCSFFTVIFSLLSKLLNHLSHCMTEGFSFARAHSLTGSSYAHNSAQHWLDNYMANIILSDYDFDSFLPQ